MKMKIHKKKKKMRYESKVQYIQGNYSNDISKTYVKKKWWFLKHFFLNLKSFSKQMISSQISVKVKMCTHFHLDT